nr:hypothetical protein [Acidobacteriota bacterium]
TITEIELGDTQGFGVEVQKCPCSVDGAQTFPVKISRPFFTGLGGPNAGEKSINVNVKYTVDGKMANKQIPLTFIYSTAAVIYYFYGFVGLLLGYIVKSLLAKQNERDADGKPLQMGFVQYLFKNPTKLVVVLVLGFAVLLYADLQGTTIYGFREAIILGLCTGILGDEGLVQKISALR